MFSRQQITIGSLVGGIVFIALCFAAGTVFGILTTVKPPRPDTPYIGKFDISDFEKLRAKYGADRYVIDSRTGQFIMIGPDGKEAARLDWTEK